MELSPKLYHKYKGFSVKHSKEAPPILTPKTECHENENK